MIRLIEALNYRCLRYVRQEMGPFHVLVGPNASGKSTFLDVVAFLGQFISEGAEAAIRSRSPNPQDLIWNHKGNWFELAIELAIPEELRKNFDEPIDTIRYEVAFGKSPKTEKFGIVGEAVLLKQWEVSGNNNNSCSTNTIQYKTTILTPENAKGTLSLFRRVGHAIAISEESTILKNQGHEQITHDRTFLHVIHSVLNSSIPVEKRESILETLVNVGPYRDQKKRELLLNTLVFSFAAVITFAINETINANIHTLSLDSHALRNPSPPGQGINFKPNGSNLPLVVEHLKAKNEARFRDWITHLRTALPDLEDIEVIDRPEDRHRWLRLCYQGDLKVPSWLVSDGTLRLLALTLPAYLPDLKGVFLVEEPENGIHPRAIETMVQSLRSVYGAQVLLATHSPVVLGVTSPEEVLCFDRMQDGSTSIVLGSEHPALRDWQHDTDLGSLFAAGVLG